MATTTPSPPHEQVEENPNYQPPITNSPPQEFVPSPPIEYLDHQFTTSISPSLPPQQPENSADLYLFPPPEDIEHQHEPPVQPPSPPEHKFYHQPPPPPPTATELPPDNFIQNHEYPLPTQQPSPSPSTPPTAPPTSQTDPNPNLDHQSPAKSPIQSNPSPSPSPSPNPNPNPNQSPKNPSPSPPPTTRSPPGDDTLEPITTVTPPLGIPLLPAPSPLKPQISPWTHQETVNLIQAYQEKWYSLKKGPLKAGQWEEVAITVAARCGYDEPTKTSKQCRHKLEKLRKRYRTERGKPRSKANAWNFFKLMDNLEKGPLPISSSQSMALVEYQKPSSSNGKKRKVVYREDDDIDDDDDNDDENNDDGDDEYVVNKRTSRSRSSSGSKKYSPHVPNGYLARNLRYADSGSRVVRGLRTPVVHKRKVFKQEEEEEEEEGGGEEGVATQLAAEIKGFAEKFVKMENKKIEMIRDVERYRLEMENKRMQMVLESQQMLVETVNKAFSSSLKANKLSAN
ncbi:uncharacterized protein LOC143546540 [Bidens hawaiensis]|uniref:uncharacterized protein LOC143546540 n=1 Tax=Bidens hawaiensis TaxID=980011 RepID=UPI0040499D39